MRAIEQSGQLLKKEAKERTTAEAQSDQMRSLVLSSSEKQVNRVRFMVR